MSKKFKSEAENLGIDYAELVVDQIIEESLAYLPVLAQIGEEMPIVKTFLTVVKIPRSISDVVLAHKVYKFLYSSGLSEKKIEKLKEKFDSTEQKRLWQSVVNSINSHDDEFKSEIVGKLFNKLVDGYITKNEYFEMVHATNNINTFQLHHLLEYYKLVPEYVLPANIKYSFGTLGLLHIYNESVGRMNGGGPLNPPSLLGWKYTGIVFDFPPSGIEGVFVGEGELVKEIRDAGMPTGMGFPLKYMVEEGLKYSKIKVYALNSKGQLLVDEKNYIPHCIDEKEVTVDDEPKSLAIIRNPGYTKGPASIYLQNDNGNHLWQFIVESEIQVSGSLFKPIEEVERFLERIPVAGIDEMLKLTEQMKRFALPDGELNEDWNSMYDNTHIE